jgi:hypothetical protein
MMQIQAVNDVGNLLAAVCLAATLIFGAVLASRTMRGRQVRGPVIAILVCFCIYATVLVGVSLLSRTRKLALGTDKCFDDWCATVINARSTPDADGSTTTKRVAVTLRVTNRAQRAAFRPSQPRISLVLAAGVEVTPSVDGQREFEKQAGPQDDLAKRLVAGESFESTLVFEVPAATREASVVLLEGPVIITRFLVGDENSFWHKKMVYQINVN